MMINEDKQQDSDVSSGVSPGGSLGGAHGVSPDGQSRTFRATVPALEQRLGKAYPVLDHGFVRVVDYMGDDAAVVQAARVSYGKGTKSLRNDTGLIRYLLRHRHTTPFEMCEIKFHVKLPVFIARQWIRHRTASVNEYSARYSVLDKEFYIPEPDQLAAQSAQNNQGRGETLKDGEARDVIGILEQEAGRTYDQYENLLNRRFDGSVIDESKQGLARELARMALPLNAYTQWYWKVNLHNLMHFLALRSDPHAQSEIRAYAALMLEMVKDWVPAVYAAFVDYRQEAFSLSGPMKAMLADRLKGVKKPFEAYGLSAREYRELVAAMDLPD